MNTLFPVVLITGASTGIGLALTKLLMGLPYRVVATARATALPRFEAANVLNAERVWVRALDVTKEAERKQLVEEVVERWGRVDVLVNNAGISYRAVGEHIGVIEAENQFAVNVLAPMQLTRQLLPVMREQRKGHIINISSVGGMMAMPTMGLYSASKFALEGASEALWYEMRPWGVRVVLVQPGFIRSDGFQHVYLSEEAHQQPADYQPYYEAMTQFITRMMESTWATPESVAKGILRVIEDPDPPLRVAGTWDARWFSLLRRLLPRGLYHRFLYANLPNIKNWVPDDAL